MNASHCCDNCGDTRGFFRSPGKDINEAGQLSVHQQDQALSTEKGKEKRRRIRSSLVTSKR